MNPKYSIKVLPTEKELYRIFKDLEKHGRTIFNYPDRSKHSGIARSIGIRCKPLIENDLFFPPLSSTNKHRMTGVQLPIGVSVKEEGKGKFFFKRRRTPF